MAVLKAYNNYKPAEYDYISQLPVGWKLLPNIAVFQERIKRGHVGEELLSVTIGKGVIRQTDIDIKKDSSNEDKSKYKLIKVGDIAYNKMRMWQGALGYSDYQGISSPAYVILKSKLAINPKYFHYMFRSGFYTDYSKRFSYGIVDDQLSLRYTHFKRMYSIVPPLKTQNAIVVYLDRKTSKIQEFISKKERLIELLEEEKGSIIGSIVNNFLITTIPLKYLCNRITDGSHASPQIIQEGKNYITVTDIGKNNDIDLINCKKISKLNFSKLEKLGCRPKIGDVLLTKDGTIGRAYMVNESNDFVALSSLAIITPNKKKVIAELLSLILISPLSVDQMYSKIQGSALTRLTIGLIKNLEILLPYTKEDQLIAVHKIGQKHLEINSAISKAQTEIQKIKEYQESLITQVVTGQLKVPDLNSKESH